VEVCPHDSAPKNPEWWGWKTQVLIYKNKSVVWLGGPHAASGHPNPASWDYTVGDGALDSSYSYAEQLGKGKYVDIPMKESEYLILAVNDSHGYFTDNSGGIDLSITYINPQITGIVFKDENKNKTFDEDIDIPIQGVTVYATFEKHSNFAITESDGSYKIDIDNPGLYDIEISLEIGDQDTIEIVEPIIWDSNQIYDKVDISVKYKWVNYSGKAVASTWQLWHQGPILKTQTNVILVGGFQPFGVTLSLTGESPQTSWGELSGLLQKKKFGQFNVWQFEYAQRSSDSIVDYGKYLSAAADRMKSLSSPTVNIIGFSMGGLVARQYIQTSNKLNLGKLLTIATPHFGSEVAVLDGSVRAKEMQPGSRFLWDLNTSWQYMGTSFAAIGGTTWRLTNNDLVVNVSSASLFVCSENRSMEKREYFETFPSIHFNDISNINNENDGIFRFISAFLITGSHNINQSSKDFGGEPFVSMAFKKEPKLIIGANNQLYEYPQVIVLNTGNVYKPGFYPRVIISSTGMLYIPQIPGGFYFQQEQTSKKGYIWWFKGSKLDAGEIRIYYAPGKYLVRWMEQGQSTVIVQPIDNTSE
jgi:hypothetical protein